MPGLPNTRANLGVRAMLRRERQFVSSDQRYVFVTERSEILPNLVYNKVDEVIVEEMRDAVEEAGTCLFWWAPCSLGGREVETEPDAEVWEVRGSSQFDYWKGVDPRRIVRARLESSETGSVIEIRRRDVSLLSWEVEYIPPPDDTDYKGAYFHAWRHARKYATGGGEAFDAAQEVLDALLVFADGLIHRAEGEEIDYEQVREVVLKYKLHLHPDWRRVVYRAEDERDEEEFARSKLEIVYPYLQFWAVKSEYYGCFPGRGEGDEIVFVATRPRENPPRLRHGSFSNNYREEGVEMIFDGDRWVRMKDC